MFKGACRGVTRIYEGRFSGFIALFVKLCKVGIVDEDFSADF